MAHDSNYSDVAYMAWMFLGLLLVSLAALVA